MNLERSIPMQPNSLTPGANQPMVAYMVEAPMAKSGVEQEPSLSKRHLDAINRVLARYGKEPVNAEDVIIRPVRLTGNQVTANYTRFKDSDLRKMVNKIPGIPLLAGHDVESLPIGTFYKATLTEEGENLWLDAWVFFLNDEEGQAIVDRIDKGIYNETSIGWAYTFGECSVCGRDYFSGYPLKYFVDVKSANELSEEHDVCLHVIGERYKGQLCYIWTTGEVTPLEGSIVYRGAHPGTRIGGKAVASPGEPVDAPYRQMASKLAPLFLGKQSDSGTKPEPEVKELVVTSGYIPSDPPEDDLDSDPSWSAPTLRDFLRYLDRDEGTRWEDLPKEERRFIMRHYAWAPTDDPDDWTFTDLKLPHHKVGGVVSWGGVRAAAQRLPNTDISDADKERVRQHLARHYRQFGRTPPWEESSAEDTMEAKPEVMDVANEPVVDELTSLRERVAKLEASLAEAQESVANLVQAKAKLEDELAHASKLAKVGHEYLKAMASEAIGLRVSLEGAEAAEAYEAVLEAWIAEARADVLRAEVDRLRKLKEKLFPGGRLSVEQPVDSGAEKPRFAFTKLSGFKVGR